MKNIRVAFYLVVIISLSVLISACGAETSDISYELAQLNDMHPSVQSAPKVVQEAYQFAHTNSETLKQVPCYCGCGGMGHTSNYACYVNETESGLEFDGHALGCSICVDITQDVMRLMNDDQSLADIQEFVDNKYSAFGPSNIP